MGDARPSVVLIEVTEEFAVCKVDKELLAETGVFVG